MRNFAVVCVTVAALVAGPAVAADLPQFPAAPPPVDNGLGGSFYLRASLGLNALWAHDVTYLDGCTCSVTAHSPTAGGYGYSFGAGFGYEAGNGLRADVTVDQLNNDGLTDGTYTLHLRSTIALANAYYDFGLGGMGAGGLGAYVGAGIGGAYNSVSVTGSPSPGPDGWNYTAAGALMTGVTYDMGNVVADLGYRMIYMPTISNGSAAFPPAATAPYYINQNLIHEVRGTLRYRFN
ncbi:MAG TPA: hypothetical protein VHB23_08175 [Devosiaceae bacterium]|nr:hypothetical protein [Devosiaceae bacterium]